MRFTSMGNAIVLASDLVNVQSIIEEQQWVNHRDEFGNAHGTIIPLFPHLHEPQGNITSVTFVGAIPLVQQSAPRLSTQFSNYAAAFELSVESPNLDQATRYLDTLLWFNPKQGVTYTGHTAPMAQEHESQSITINKSI